MQSLHSKLPLSFKGEGDTGGEVDKKYRYSSSYLFPPTTLKERET